MKQAQPMGYYLETWERYVLVGRLVKEDQSLKYHQTSGELFLPL